VGLRVSPVEDVSGLSPVHADKPPEGGSMDWTRSPAEINALVERLREDQLAQVATIEQCGRRIREDAEEIEILQSESPK
jgi:hypothetical protein